MPAPDDIASVTVTDLAALIEAVAAGTLPVALLWLNRPAARAYIIRTGARELPGLRITWRHDPPPRG